MTTEPGKTPNELAVERTDLAMKRTVMGADRSLMAWIRTALSMISFGFTIYKVLEGLQKGGAELPHAHTPRNVGLFLIGLGTVSIAMGTVEYWQTLRELGRFARGGVKRPSFVIAMVMSVTGLLLFFSLLARLL